MSITGILHSFPGAKQCDANGRAAIRMIMEKAFSNLFLVALVLALAIASAGTTHAIVASITPVNAGVDYLSYDSVTYYGSVTGPGPYNYGIRIYSTADKTRYYCDYTVVSDTPNTSVKLITLFSSNGGSSPSSTANLSTCSGGTSNGPGLDLVVGYTPYTLDLTVTNTSTNAANYSSSVLANFSIYPTLTFNSLTASPRTIYTSNTLNFDVSWINQTGYITGTPPYTVNITYGTSTSCSSDTTEAALEANVPSNEVPLSIQATASSAKGLYYYCAKVTDSSYGGPISVESQSPIEVNVTAVPAASEHFPSSADVGQSTGVGYVIHNGIGSFTVDLESVNSITGNTIQIGSNTTDLSGGSGSIYFNVPTAPGNAIYNLAVLDHETNNGGSGGTGYEFYTSNAEITVNPTLAAPSVSLSSNTVEQGDNLQLTSTWTGGTSPYNISVSIYNSTSNTLVSGLAGLTASNIASTSNSILIPANDIKPGKYFAKVEVTDSSGAGAETNMSAPSQDFTVILGPSLAESLSNATTTYPNSPSFKLTGTRGTVPYEISANVIAVSNNTAVYSISNTIDYAGGFVNETLPALIPGKYYLNATLSDSASPSVVVYASKEFTVNKLLPTLTLNIPPNSVASSNAIYLNGSISPASLVATFTQSQVGGASSQVATTNSLTGEFSYNAILGSGTYNFELSTSGNTIYAPENVIKTLVLSTERAITSLSGPSSFAYNGANALITASIYPDTSSVVGNLYMLVNGGAEQLVGSTSTSNVITYNAPSIPGSYTFKFNNTPNDLAAENVSTISYTISKAVPMLNFTKRCSSYVFNGAGCNTTASISTLYGQLSGSLYANSIYSNSIFVGTTTNSISYTSSNAIGTYSFVLNTSGNGNYLARSISYSYSINPIPGPSPSGTSSISGSTPTTITTTDTTSTIYVTPVVKVPKSSDRYSGSVGVSSSKPLHIDFENMNASVIFTAPNENLTKISFTIDNYTGPKPDFSGHVLENAIVINFTSNSTVIANITLPYDCNSFYASAPYILRNGSFVAITNYTISKSSCTLSFSISSDPIIAVFENVSSSPVSAKTSDTTSIPARTVTVPPQKPHPSYLIYGVAVIIVIMIVALAVARFRPGRGKATRRS